MTGEVNRTRLSQRTAVRTTYVSQEWYDLWLKICDIPKIDHVQLPDKCESYVVECT
jgi:hypothetical protein